MVYPLQNPNQVVMPFPSAWCYKRQHQPTGVNMSKHIPTIILLIACIVLSVILVQTKQELSSLKQAAQTPEVHPEMSEDVPAADKDQVTADSTEQLAVAEELEPVKEAEAEEQSGRRMMATMAKAMGDNPTMNKVMEASQRGAVGALYADMIEYLNLNAEETKYFMDILMQRQMTHVEFGMKLMSGEITEEEKAELMKAMKEAEETVKTEMEKFLNNADDFEEFKYYEKTMGERMMLSQMDQALAGTDHELTDETYREVLDMMHEEKKSFDFKYRPA